ncbi:stage II sporulation protein P [Anaeroselena agilis]|uniref:Stage II sporulation protein P n=1 Tax=Anaeroselena agilis TaxID=3063788 RepID=A0ABU3P110_9FIRM|nr:stage II sporulation protein P [Selenomonadales bacterium 4137-cl]
MGRVAFYLALCLCLATPLAPAEAADPHELTAGYMTVADERGAVILETGLIVRPGDMFIGEDNRLYEINAVEGTLAKARFLRDEPLAALDASIPVQAPVPPPGGPVPAAPVAPDTVRTPSPAPPQQLIAIYYTHNDESYIPTDGKATINGNGGIFNVGGAFARRLIELGYAVENDQTRHDPHDANAYQRSRRTFKRLLEQGPAASFDIHRDSAPLSSYQVTIDGQPAAKMLLVVGRQNQNRQTTLNYAKKIKAAVDSRYKGLIRGIFIAHGNYNQDLSPRTMLVEMGTQYNSRDAAERTAAFFADTVPLFLAPPPKTPVAAAAPGSEGPPAADEGGFVRDIVNIVAVLVAGIAGFLFISTGSWREARRKLARFRRLEFTNFLGKKRKE